MEGNFVVHRCFRHVNFFVKTCGMKMSISISELSAENGVAVVNAYGSITGDNEDRVDDSTTELCRYFVRHHGGNILSPV